MGVKILILSFFVVVTTCFAKKTGHLPVKLTCEYETDPVGIDNSSPCLSWQIESGERNWHQSAYQILVASSLEKLGQNKGDLWNSGKILSDQNIGISYSGKELQSLLACYWKVKTWDRDSNASSWSKPANWTMAILSDKDWHEAQWIGARKKLPLRGYHSQTAQDINTELWIQLELPGIEYIDSIVLHPSNRSNWLLRGGQGMGYGFPVRYKIDISEDEKFRNKKTIANYEDADYSNPASTFFAFSRNQTNPIPGINDLRRSFTVGKLPVRIIRLTGFKLWQKPHHPACLSLSEIEVFSGGKNIASKALITAINSVENDVWSLTALVDGEGLCRSNVYTSEHAALYLRKEFETGKKIKRAVASISGLGFNELFINGTKIGNRILEPTWTDYDDRVSFSTYDVTSNIKKSANSIGVILGNGWYNLPAHDTWGFNESPWIAPKKLLFELNMEYDDGSREVIISDTSWKWSLGPIVYNCIRGGETVDSREMMPDWSDIKFDMREWKPVVSLPSPKGRLCAQYTSPVCNHESVKPISISEPRPNVYVFDFGVNISGWIQFQTTGKSGQKIQFEFNEKLDSSGNVDMKHCRTFTYGRYQTGELILDGKGQNTYEPKFTYHAFRFVQVTGLSVKPKLADMVAKPIYAGLQPVGSFSCSNEMLNKAQDVLLRTASNYIHHMPADPIREKLGWTQDAQTCADMTMYNFQMARLYKKWIQDFYDNQEQSGHIIPIAPTSGWGAWEPDGNPGICSDPWWGGAAVYLPWDCYRFYGDIRFIRDGYENMKRYVDFLGTTAEDNILSWQLGDWLEIGSSGKAKRTPVNQTSTSAYFYVASLVEKIALILDKKDDARKYQKLKENIKESFNRHFLNGETGEYAKDSQTSQILPLILGMVPENKEELVLKVLMENIRDRNNHLSTGFVGLLPLMYGLDDFGMAELSYKIAVQEDYPGWLLMVNKTGSIWESWIDNRNNNGQCFISLGGPLGAWMYRTLGGIRPDEKNPGFKHIIIKPSFTGDLKWVNSSHTSLYGKIVSNWKIENDQLTMDITIPPNATASVYIPVKDVHEITENGINIEKVSSIKTILNEDEKTFVSIGSGIYHFKAKIEK